MERYRICVSKSYYRDLRNIVYYILRNLDAPYTAAELLDDVEAAVSGLSTKPDRFAVVSDVHLGPKGFRKCPVKNYVVLYKIDEENKTVLVYRILHARLGFTPVGSGYRPARTRCCARSYI